MANLTCYFGIEILNLTNNQRNTLIDGLKTLGQNNSNKPNEKNHWRTRLDNQAVIFEALFNEDHLTINAIKQRLANIFNVDIGTISHSTNQVSMVGLVITFAHGGQSRVRMVAFGHDGLNWGTWAESNAAARSYLFTNMEAWEAELP